MSVFGKTKFDASVGGKTKILERAVQRTRTGVALLADAMTDSLLGIETKRPLWQPPGPRKTEPMPYAAIRTMTGPLALNGDDVVCDLGCGKGRLVCWFSRLQVSLCIGVEFDESLASQAQRNADAVRRRKAPIEIRHEDASKSDLSQVSVLLMFNPFGAEVMAPVLENLRACLRARPRRLRIAYARPVQLHVFDQYPEFQVFERVMAPNYSGRVEIAFLLADV